MIILDTQILGYKIEAFQAPDRIVGNTLIFEGIGEVTIGWSSLTVRGKIAAVINGDTVKISNSVISGGSSSFSVNASGGTVAIGGHFKGDLKVGG